MSPPGGGAGGGAEAARGRCRIVSGEPAEEHALQRLGRHRLGDEVVHAGCEAGGLVLVEGVGGHGQDGDVGVARQTADLPGRLEAVHDRHLHVHQDQVVVAPGGALDGLLAVVGQVDGEPEIGQHVHGDLLIEWIVLDQQHLGARQLAGGRGHDLDRRIGLGRRQRNAGPLLEACGEPEHAAPAGLALGPRLAAHQTGQVPGQGQPQARAAVLAGGRGVGLLEGLEQAAELFGRDADAAVAHLEAHQQRIAGVVLDMRAQVTAPCSVNFTALLR
jgi:hypothetical protein